MTCLGARGQASFVVPKGTAVTIVVGKLLPTTTTTGLLPTTTTAPH